MQPLNSVSGASCGRRGESPQKCSRGEYRWVCLFEFREMGIAGDETVRFCGARQSNQVIITRVGSEPGCYLWIWFNRGQALKQSDV